MRDFESRLAAIDRVLADPPQVHISSTALNGAWSSPPSEYRYLAANVEPGSRTLETGLGVSTVLFTLWGCEHTCVVFSDYEADTCLKYLDSRGIDASRLTIQRGPSEQVLPTLELSELDLVFIDGCHGFPVPIIDWFYASSMLRAGGVAVLDDMSLRQVELGLGVFLAKDPRWQKTASGPRWIAYRRSEGGSLSEEWTDQQFLGETWRAKAARLTPDSVRPAVKRAAERLHLA